MIKLIDEIVSDLIQYSNEYNKNEIDKDTLNLQLELLKAKIERFEIDFSRSPLDNLKDRFRSIYKQMLVRHKLKAISYITNLQEANDKRRYNRIARMLVKNRLFFASFEATIIKNFEAYRLKNGLNYVYLQVLIMKEVETDGNQ